MVGVDGLFPEDGDERVAERSVLGAMLRDNSVIGDVAVILRKQDFTSDAHNKVFAAILGLWESGEPVDLVMTAEELRRRGHLDDVKAAYLYQLFDEVPTAALAVHYAKIVRERSVLRRLHILGHRIAANAANPNGPAEQVLAEAERELHSISQLGVTGEAADLDDVLSEAIERVDQRSAGNAKSGILTGFTDLDDLTGGLHNSELTILAARPSCGKTALGLSIAHNAALRGEPVFFVSLEQSKAELGERMLCAQARVDSKKLRQGWVSKEDAERIGRAKQELAGRPLFIDDTACQTMLRIAANARRLKARRGIRLVVVDYLQLVEPDSRRDVRQEQVAGISRRLKQLARELDVPVLALAQLNRAVEDRQGQRPRLSDLRESGSIEADADVVLLLHRPPDQGRVIDLIVAKQRNGPTGETSLVFDREHVRFDNYAPNVPSFEEHKNAG